MSKLHWTICAAVVLLIATAGAVEAQQPGGGGRGRGRGGPGGFGNPAMMRVMLLSNDKVQKELELNDDQKSELKKIGEELRPAGGGGNFQNLSDDERAKQRTERDAKMKEAQAKVDKILVPQQQERLKQISWQVAGAQALSDPEVSEKLKITDKQKEDIKAVQDKAGEETRALFQGGGSREENQTKMADIRKASEEKTLAVLTPEQKTEFDKLKGDKVEISFADLFGAGGGRGRRGNRPAGAPANP